MPGTLKPGVELSEDEALLWRQVIESPMGETYEAEQIPLILEYVRSSVSANRVAQGITDYCAEEGFDVLTYDRLLKSRERIGSRVADLAVKLRIAPSARTHKDKAGTIARKPRGTKPWES